MKVVAHRVDGLVLAFRVRFSPLLLQRISERSHVAEKHGRASFHYAYLRGALQYSRVRGRWLVRNASCHALIDASPRGVEQSIKEAATVDGAEVGWNLEIKFLAEALAVTALDELIAQAERCARSLGAVEETRLRRIDLCADVAGWELSAEDRQRLVKRSRATVADYDAPQLTARALELARGIEGAKTLKDARAMAKRVREAVSEAHTDRDAAPVIVHGQSLVTGLTVGAGGAVMARVYDKTAEIELHDEARRTIERTRWNDGGWDGIERVTRVEFQLRGEAVRDFGLRNPAAPFDPVTGEVFAGGISARLDPLWQALLNWVRLIEPRTVRQGRNRGRPLQRSRCPDDARWSMLRAVRFRHKHEAPARRRRLRGGVSAAQWVGTTISLLAHAGALRAMPEDAGEVKKHELSMFLQDAGIVAAQIVNRELVERWGSEEEAFAHVGIVGNAARARVEEFGSTVLPLLEEKQVEV